MLDEVDLVASDFKRSLPERLENKEVKTEDKEVEIKKADSIELNKEEEAML